MNFVLQIPALNFKMFPLWMFYYFILYAFLYFPNFLHGALSVFHNWEKHFLKCSFHCPAWKKKNIHDEEQYKTLLLITQIPNKYYFLALVFANWRKQKPNPTMYAPSSFVFQLHTNSSICLQDHLTYVGRASYSWIRL